MNSIIDVPATSVTITFVPGIRSLMIPVGRQSRIADVLALADAGSAQHVRVCVNTTARMVAWSDYVQPGDTLIVIEQYTATPTVAEAIRPLSFGRTIPPPLFWVFSLFFPAANSYCQIRYQVQPRVDGMTFEN